MLEFDWVINSFRNKVAVFFYIRYATAESAHSSGALAKTHRREKKPVHSRVRSLALVLCYRLPQLVLGWDLRKWTQKTRLTRAVGYCCLQAAAVKQRLSSSDGRRARSLACDEPADKEANKLRKKIITRSNSSLYDGYMAQKFSKFQQISVV